MSENTDSAGLHVVLFGAAGAGKSALLGALAQAAQTQPETLGSPVTDPTGGLADLQKKTYEHRQSETLDDIVSYPVTLGAGGGAKLAATLVDCSGQVAQDFLAGKRSLAENAGLAGAIRQADALVLAVAPAASSQLEQSFQQLARFLQALEQRRGRNNDIAGLPVYLVLTKCDLLASKDDTVSKWMQRIEEGKRQLGNRFKEFLAQARLASFGTIELRLWATAVERPALADRPARPRDPYGVAELFRQVLDSAQVFHGQRRRAQQRLRVAVLGLLGLIAFLGLVAGGFWLTRPSAALAALENSLQAAWPSAPASAAERLREPLDGKMKELAKIRANPEFAHLPPATQDEVRQGLQELEVYQNLSKKFDALKRVRFFRREEDIKTYGQAVDQIVLPETYASQWANSRLAKKIQQYQSELVALTRALAEEKDWLKAQTKEGEALRRMAIPGEGSPERQAWINRANGFLKRKDLTKDVPGVPHLKLRELYEFPTVNSLRDDYEAIRSRVEKIRGGLINA